MNLKRSGRGRSNESVSVSLFRAPCAHFIVAGMKVEELADRLVKKEEEGARELVKAAGLEARLHEANER